MSGVPWHAVLLVSCLSGNQITLFPVDLGSFWILSHIIESYQAPRWRNCAPVLSFLNCWERYKSLSCHIFLPSCLQHWPTWQTNSKSPPDSKAARQKPAVLSSVKTFPGLNGWGVLLSQYSCFFFSWKAGPCIGPTWIVVLFITFSFFAFAEEHINKVGWDEGNK